MRTPAPENSHLLEISLISAQGLKPPAAALRRLQTYAVAWVDSSAKLRSRIDRVGGPNPTWNDKFIFRVDSDFLAGETSAVTVDIFAVGVLRDHLLGSVRFLLSNVISSSAAIAAVQIRRPSGRFHGVLNVGAAVIDGGGLESLAGVSAIGYRDLTGVHRRRKHRRREISDVSSGESCGGDDSVDFSDGTESTGSTSSSSAASTVLKELNGLGLGLGLGLRKGEMAGKKEAVILCTPVFQRKMHPSPSDRNLISLDLK